MRKIKYKKGRKVQPLHLEYTGIHKNSESEMQLFVYDDLTLTEFEKINVADFDTNITIQKTNWLNLHGLNDTELINALGDYFAIDSFMLSDILNTTKRTKLEEQQEVLFFNIKSLLPKENTDTIQTEQISF